MAAKQRQMLDERLMVGWWSLAIGAAGVLCYLLAPVFTPFLIAALLAYLANPVVVRLFAFGMPRLLGVLLVFSVMCLLAISLIVFLVPLVERQISVFMVRLPELVDWLQQGVVPWLQQQFGVAESLDFAVLKQAFGENWRQLGGTAASLLATMSRSGLALLALLANLVLVPVVTFYLLRDWERLMLSLRALVPRNLAPQLFHLSEDCDEVLATFMRGQFLVMLVLGVVYSLGLWFAGIELALLIGLLAALVSFVPYLGLIIGVTVATVAAWIQFHDLSHLLPVLIVFGVGQLLESFLLTPLLVGDRIGLHPVAVIFAVMAGGQLFGFFGVLLALPVAAVVAVLLRYACQRYLDSPLYSPAEDSDET